MIRPPPRDALRVDNLRLACQPKLTLGLACVSEGWSGRRGSNPRPTAWKAVTLPLSYSRVPIGQSASAHRIRRYVASPAPTRSPSGGPMNRLQQADAKLVARGGFEPPKPLGRQIYSLLRLTASLPRRCRAPLQHRNRPRPEVGSSHCCVSGLCAVREIAPADRVAGENPCACSV